MGTLGIKEQRSRSCKAPALLTAAIVHDRKVIFCTAGSESSAVARDKSLATARARFFAHCKGPALLGGLMPGLKLRLTKLLFFEDGGAFFVGQDCALKEAESCGFAGWKLDLADYVFALVVEGVAFR